MELTDPTLKSELLLSELKRHDRSNNIVDVEERRTKVVLVTVGGNSYAFYGDEIREILPACEISWVPGLPDFLPGLVIVRGEVESVIDIRHFLGGDQAAAQTGLIALAVSGDFRSGILIDSVEDVVDVPQSSIKPPLSTLSGAARDLVAGEIDLGETVIPLLDIGKLAARVTL